MLTPVEAYSYYFKWMEAKTVEEKNAIWEEYERKNRNMAIFKCACLGVSILLLGAFVIIALFIKVGGG